MPLWLVLLVTLTAPVASRQPSSNGAGDYAWTADFEQRQERLRLNDVGDFEVRFLFHPASRQHDRIITTTRDAVRLFTEWFGRPRREPLTIVDRHWRREPSGEIASAIVISSRRFVPASDVSLERSLIATLAAHYWTNVSRDDAASSPFVDGLARYTATRAINELLRDRHFQTFRFFGEFVPYRVPGILLSRPLRDPRPLIRHAELDRVVPSGSSSPSGWGVASRATQDVLRTEAALHTLEKLIGWPALQQALAVVADDAAESELSATQLAAVIGRHRGADMDWFFRRAFTSGVALDYGIARFESTMREGAYETVVHAQHYGASLTEATGGGADAEVPEPFLEIVTRFADGADARQRWDGREDLRLTYASTAPALSASTDAHTAFLLDSNRLNNTRVADSGFSSTAMRLSLHWITWLQDLVLTYTAIV